LPSGECKGELRGHDNVIECIAWAPDSAGVNISEIVSNGGTEVTDFFVFEKFIRINRFSLDTKTIRSLSCIRCT